jgi:hypothetical protein
MLAVLSAPAVGSDGISFNDLAAEYARDIRPIIKQFCLECHSAEALEGDLDLEQFARLEDVRRASRTWVKVREKLAQNEMPPQGEPQPSPAERERLRGWVARYLRAEALTHAGDPGPVVLRRLNNAEYTYTIQDLTGFDLQPAREFPADSAAGEGFTNTGNALVMSPALLTKFLDAGKAIAAHAVLLPDGVRFSRGSTRRDWTDELLAQIRAFYAQFADPEGRLRLEPYVLATLEDRDALARGNGAAAGIAERRRLNARYLESLWNVLASPEPSPLLDALRDRWRAARAADAAAVAAEIARWQAALSRFQKVGHMKPWVVPVSPLTTQQELRLKFPEQRSPADVTLYLAAGDGGDGNAADFVVWQQPRLVTAGRPDLLLRDVRAFVAEMTARRQRVFESAAECLAAAAESSAGGPLDRDELARRHGVDAGILGAWLDYLGMGSGQQIALELLQDKIASAAGHELVKGWGTPETPNLVASSSDTPVRIPGNLRAHGVAVHPSPTRYAGVGWRSPVAGTLRVEGAVTHAHPECGNGVTWSLELRRGATRRRLAAGTAAGTAAVKVGPIDRLAVRSGDLLSLLIGPRDGNHACDLTDLRLSLRDDGGREWDLSRDVSSDVLAGNPHADRHGNQGVWHFYSELVAGHDTGPVIPAGSLLARWLAAPDDDQARAIASDIQRLLTTGPPSAREHPDAALYRQLSSLAGPLLARLPRAAESRNEGATVYGLDPSRFGHHPSGSPIDAASLCIQAPAVVELRLPADLVAGCELVVTAALHVETGREGSVQPRLLTTKPEPVSGLRPDAPVLVAEGSAARARLERAFDEFRRLLPAALCYTKIVPVDEVVTLTLFHREDEPLCRLMLDDPQRARLDRLWDELHFISQDALTLVDAFAQLMEYATQDSDPRLFEPFRKPIHERAAAFRKALVEAEPRQLDGLMEFAARAFRRPLADSEARQLRALYAKLRAEAIPHDEALRLILARVLVAPAFLYRLENSPPGDKAAPVTDWELASRLSYFLWSSLPDEELRGLAAAGSLRDPSVLAAQARRMLRDVKVRRLATEFACQWLHIYEFNALDEKSARHFPAFAQLRSTMYEESIRFFTDLFQADRSVLSIFDADHTFLNESLAQHYGIPGITGAEWRRVDGVRQYRRGGILAQATTLSKQSGASRTSPILRGNWVSEVLLGEKLPRPPKDVPRLPEEEPNSGELTVRQLVERHTSDPRCSKCHIRIDPLGYALEGFDAIGRLRTNPVDTRARLQDGSEFDGIDGLRNYLVTNRRDPVVTQFCRKLLGYALGRGVQLSDEPLLDEMRQELDRNEYRFSAAVTTIIRSRPFREIRGREMALISNRDPQ